MKCLFPGSFVLIILVAVGGDVEPSKKQKDIDVGVVIGAIGAVFIVFLLIIDVSCYFMNNCGILMCICVHLCGFRHHRHHDQIVEEGEM